MAKYYLVKSGGSLLRTNKGGFYGSDSKARGKASAKIARGVCIEIEVEDQPLTDMTPQELYEHYESISVKYMELAGANKAKASE